MRLNPIVYTLIFLRFYFASTYTVNRLKCEICRAIVEEVAKTVNSVSSTILTDIGSYRLDDKGNKMSYSIPLVQSDAFLVEALESACDQMQNYARGYDKKTKELRVVKIRSGDRLTSGFSDIDLISDADLNESLLYYCQGLIDEHENKFIEMFKPGKAESVENFCQVEMGFCEEEEEEKGAGRWNIEL